MSRKGVGKGEREVIVERAVTERAAVRTEGSVNPKANQDFFCLLWGEEKRITLLYLCYIPIIIIKIL
jgi:hypothetical protein